MWYNEGMKERAKSKSGNKNGGLKAKTQKIKEGILKSYYGNPTKDMRVIAVTGTTGRSQWRIMCTRF